MRHGNFTSYRKMRPRDVILQPLAHRTGDSGTVGQDRVKFRWLDGYLRGRLLHTITRDDVQAIGAAKSRETSRATANRYLALVRAVLKRAAGPWQWIEKAPAVSLFPEAKRRVRWLTKQEATRLLDALPTHQKQLTRFALATGLRQANVLALKWPDVDIERRTAWVHADEAKGGEAIGVPLNDEAVAVLREEFGKHPLRVFTFNGKPLGQANTRAWRNALKRAGIKNFRWHDLRHVWATWHVMAGTTMAEPLGLTDCLATNFVLRSHPSLNEYGVPPGRDAGEAGACGFRNVSSSSASTSESSAAT